MIYRIHLCNTGNCVSSTNRNSQTININNENNHLYDSTTISMRTARTQTSGGKGKGCIIIPVSRNDKRHEQSRHCMYCTLYSSSDLESYSVGVTEGRETVLYELFFLIVCSSVAYPRYPGAFSVYLMHHTRVTVVSRGQRMVVLVLVNKRRLVGDCRIISSNLPMKTIVFQSNLPKVPAWLHVLNTRDVRT